MSNFPPDPPSSPISESQGDGKAVLEEAARRAVRYLDGLEGRSVFPGPEALAGLKSFDEPFPADPRGALETLSLLDSAGELRAALTHSRAAYLAEGDLREPMEYTPDMSRRARGVEVWAALRSLGRSGLAAEA